MKHIVNTDAVTNAQNEGHPCSYCGSRFGHYGACILLCGGFNPETHSTPAFDSVASAVLVISEDDAIRLRALGVSW